MSSILNDTKKNLGIAATDKSFDVDVIMHINSVLAILNQLGLGVEQGFQIEDNTAEWVDFLGDDIRLNSVKTYMYLRVRLMFDPPAISFVIASIEKQIQELEWRLNVQREELGWINPLPPAPEDTVYDGGIP